MPSVPPPFVSIVIPALDEERHVGAVLDALLPQLDPGRGEILVLDGGSRDRTAMIVRAVASANPAVRLIPNPGRTQSAACNLAAGLVDPRCGVLLRADAHAGYPPHFVRTVVSALGATGAASVVVPMRTVGTAPVQRAVAAAQNSRLGNGGAGHRRAGTSRFVDHGHHAAFDLGFFRSLGGYDPSFTHNEDAELDLRARAAGGRIWLCAEATIDYYPRSSLVRLARQYVRHGRGRARTTVKHRQTLRLRQRLPLGILLAAVLAVLAPLFPPLALPAALYLAACLGWGAAAAAARRDPALLLTGVAAVVMHLSWAIGFLDGRLRTPAPRHPPLLPIPEGVR